MPRPRTISVILPALDEAGNLEGAVRDARAAAAQVFEDYEILVVNDGSTDETGRIANSLEAELSHVRVFHHERHLGVGAAIRTGLEHARMAYVGWLPGSHTVPLESVQRLFAAVGTADVVASYDESPPAGTWERIATEELNLLSKQQLRGYFGPAIYPTELARQLQGVMVNAVFVAELLVHAALDGHTITSVPIARQQREYGQPDPFGFRDLARATGAVYRIWWGRPARLRR